MKEPTKAPDTAMAKAIFDAKIRRTPEEHSAYLTQLAREAWQKCSAAGGSAVRRSHIRAALCNDPTYALMEQWQPDALKTAIGALLAKVREDIKTEATKQNAARKAAGGGQTLIDAQNGITPTETPSGDKPADNRGQLAFDTHAPIAPVVTTLPNHAQPKAGRGSAPAANGSAPMFASPAAPLTTRAQARGAAIEAVARRLSALDTFKYDGTPIGKLTANQVRTWMRNTPLAVRFGELMTAGLPPDGLIEKYRTPDEADALLTQARREIFSNAAAVLSSAKIDNSMEEKNAA